MENQSQQPVGETQGNQEKPWYKKWWGVIVAILIWPIFLIWFIWNKTQWGRNTKIASTIGITILAIIVFSNTNSSVDDAKKKAGEAKTTQEQNVQAEQVGNPKPAEQKVQEPALIELSDVGQKASKKFTLENGLSIFRLTHTGTSHFGVWLMDSNGERVELLVNNVGKFDGSKAVGIANKGEYILDISADGKWTVKIEQPRPATADAKPRTFTGKGQQVSPFIALNKGLTTFSLNHSGTSHFGVWLMDSNGERVELLVNNVGKFDGSKAVGISSSGLYLLDISADGDWTISVE